MGNAGSDADSRVSYLRIRSAYGWMHGTRTNAREDKRTEAQSIYTYDTFSGKKYRTATQARSIDRRPVNIDARSGSQQNSQLHRPLQYPLNPAAPALLVKGQGLGNPQDSEERLSVSFKLNPSLVTPYLITSTSHDATQHCQDCGERVTVQHHIWACKSDSFPFITSLDQWEAALGCSNLDLPKELTGRAAMVVEARWSWVIKLH